jgi:hypothetical protein
VRGRSRPAAGSTLAATLTAYEGALATLRAKHALWPPRKLQHLRAGLAVLDATIEAHPEHAEARYLRLMSCYYLPSILGRGGSVQEDFAALARLLPGAPGPVPGRALPRDRRLRPGERVARRPRRRAARAFAGAGGRMARGFSRPALAAFELCRAALDAAAPPRRSGSPGSRGRSPPGAPPAGREPRELVGPVPAPRGPPPAPAGRAALHRDAPARAAAAGPSSAASARWGSTRSARRASRTRCASCSAGSASGPTRWSPSSRRAGSGRRTAGRSGSSPGWSCCSATSRR